MRTFVLSDIHGCYLELVELLAQLNGDFQQDRLIMLGDYIDRGPQSIDVVKKVIELQQQFGPDHIILLRGNHEQMAFDFYTYRDRLWNYNGNESTIASFKNNHDDVRNYLDFFHKLPLFHEDDFAFFVHAGINPENDLAQQCEEDLLNIREPFFLSRKRFSKTVIFGHTPTRFMTGRDFPVILPDRIGIDTGCVYGGYLSILEIKDGRCINLIQTARKHS